MGVLVGSLTPRPGHRMRWKGGCLGPNRIKGSFMRLILPTLPLWSLAMLFHLLERVMHGRQGHFDAENPVCHSDPATFALALILNPAPCTKVKELLGPLSSAAQGKDATYPMSNRQGASPPESDITWRDPGKSPIPKARSCPPVPFLVLSARNLGKLPENLQVRWVVFASTLVGFGIRCSTAIGI
jgi:hypothetical protein